MKNYLCIQIIYLFIAFSISNNVYALKYGLGSCLDQRWEQNIWSSIEKEDIDGFIFLGDNVYGDLPSGKLTKMKQAYETQRKKLPNWLMNDKEILAIWDDHDFGLNDGGGNYPLKKSAEKMFLNFWNIPSEDPRRKREGIYFNHIKEIDGIKAEIIGLDTRYFRSELRGKSNAYKPNFDFDATILGTSQWNWLEGVIENSSADIIIILSSIQVLATTHPYEKWGNFPLERDRLIKLIKKASKKQTLVVISGDRHRSGIYQNKDFIEITASSLNKAASQNIETDPLLVGETYPIKNYGILDIRPSSNEITVSLFDQDGRRLNSKTIDIF